MVKIIHDIHKEVKKAIDFLAAEFKYAKEINEHLKTLKSEEANVDKAIEEARTMLKLYRWVARGERRVTRSDVKLEHLLDDLKEILPSDLQVKPDHFKTQLKVADGNLKKFASFYTGEVKHELDDIEKDEKRLKKLQESGKTDKDAEALRKKLQGELKKFETDLSYMIEWLESNQAIVEQIDAWATELESKA